MLSFAVTGADGTFQLKKTAGLERITASFMGFKTVSIPAGQFKDGQQIRMEAGGFQLKEVAVTAERIKESGDTLTYSVGGFKQAQDRSIADVIGKMPGLEVKASGAIEYQGKPINKFYIEGMDLMGSQYALGRQGEGSAGAGESPGHQVAPGCELQRAGSHQPGTEGRSKIYLVRPVRSGRWIWQGMALRQPPDGDAVQ